MTSEINSDKILIRDAFTRWFRVPEYQRPYVWTKDEVSDLLEDITEALKSQPDSQYFLGSIVFQTKKVSDASGSYEENDLLDGQQRLTTCLILHAVARDLTSNQKLKDACHTAVFQDADPFSGVPERLRIVYDIRPAVRDFTKTYLKSPGGTDNVEDLTRLAQDDRDISIRAMAAAILYVRTYFQSPDSPSLEKFFTFFRNQVLLVYVASSSLENAFRLFTVLNSRGTKLGTSDILKSINLSALKDSHATEQEVLDAAREWEDLESELRDQFDPFLGHLRTILLKNKASKSLLEEFEELIYKKNIVASGAPMLKLMATYHAHYTAIQTGDTFTIAGDWTLYNVVALLRSSPSDIWLPPLLLYRHRFGNNRITEFAVKLENRFSSDWILRATPTVRLENMNKIMRRIDEVHNDSGLPTDQKISHVLDDASLKIDIAEVQRILVTRDIYGQPYAQYVLYKLDMISGGSGHKLQPPQHTSVEHILPQNPKPASRWCQDFTDADRQTWTHRLGNLVLIGRRKNTSMGCLDFTDKKQSYFKNWVESFPNSLQVIKNSAWDLPTLEKHHQETIDRIIKHFSI